MDHHRPRSLRVLRPRIASEFASFAKQEPPLSENTDSGRTATTRHSLGQLLDQGCDAQRYRVGETVGGCTALTYLHADSAHTKRVHEAALIKMLTETRNSGSLEARAYEKIKWAKRQRAEPRPT